MGIRIGDNNRPYGIPVSVEGLIKRDRYRQRRSEPTRSRLGLAGILGFGIRARSAIELEQEARIAQLEYQLEHDKTTGLLSELGIRKHISSDRQDNPDASRGLILVDIGNFKLANGKNGKDMTAGDRFLAHCARSFQRVNDGVSRISGDELMNDGVSRLHGDEFLIYTDTAGRRERLGIDPNIILKEQVDAITGLRDDIVSVRPELAEGNVQVFIGAVGIGYDHRLSFDQNLQKVNAAIEPVKEAGHETYGAFRQHPTSAA